MPIKQHSYPQIIIFEKVNRPVPAYGFYGFPAKHYDRMIHRTSFLSKLPDIFGKFRHSSGRSIVR